MCCLFVPDLFYLTECPLGLSMLLQAIDCHAFMTEEYSIAYVYHMFSINLSTDEHLG
jgi:hypothetical protein